VKRCLSECVGVWVCEVDLRWTFATARLANSVPFSLCLLLFLLPQPLLMPFDKEKHLHMGVDARIRQSETIES